MAVVGRFVWCVTVVLLASVIGPGTPLSAAQAGPVEVLSLTLDPPEGTAGTPVDARATGYAACPPTGSDDASPGSVEFLWDGVEIATAGVVAADGSAAALFQVPDDAAIGGHTVTSRCVGDEALPMEAPFEVHEPTVVPVVVPPVIGLSPAEATKVLVGAGLVVGEVTGEVTGEGGQVQDQDPDAGVEVDPGTPVDLTFGTEEPSVVVVPDVVGRSSAEAGRILDDAGLQVGQVVGEGDVVQTQSPAAGSEVPPLAVVNLEMVAEPDEQVVVPDVVGMEIADAQATLLDSELDLGQVSGTGDVVRLQDPPAGALVPAGSSVSISVESSIEPARLVTVPNLVGLTVAESRRACQAVGLLLGDTPTTDDLVSSQQPVSGLLVPVGSTVTVAFPGPTGWIRIAVAAGLLVLLVAATAVAAVALRRHRERLWVRSHVELAPDPGPTDVVTLVEGADHGRETRHVLQLAPNHEREPTVVVKELTDDD